MLGEAEIQKLKLLLSTDGWNQIVKPTLLKRGNLAMKALRLTRSERAVEFKGSDYDLEDDALRAMIREVEWMSVVWDNEVSVFDQNRKRDELAQSNSANPG